jgi:hypothetical protein
MANFTVGSSDRVNLHIYRADNQFVVIMNDVILYDRRTEHDPKIDDTIDLTESLNPGINYLNLFGIDWGGQFHYHFEFDLNGNVMPGLSREDQGRSGANGLSKHYSYTIELK